MTNSKQMAVVYNLCGKPGLFTPACKHKETVFRKCGKIEHLQHVCPSKKATAVQPVTKRTLQNRQYLRNEYTLWLTKKLHDVDKGTDENGLFMVGLEKSHLGMLWLKLNVLQCQFN